MKYKLSRKAWQDIGKKAGWMKEASWGDIEPEFVDIVNEQKAKIREDAHFYDPRSNEEGKLVTRKYHQTTLWMMVYDSGEIQELHVGDLKRIKIT